MEILNFCLSPCNYLKKGHHCSTWIWRLQLLLSSVSTLEQKFSGRWSHGRLPRSAISLRCSAKISTFFCNYFIGAFLLEIEMWIKTDKWWGINCWSLMTPAAVPELSFKVLKCEISATGHHSCCYFTMKKKKKPFTFLFSIVAMQFFVFFRAERRELLLTGNIK